MLRQIWDQDEWLLPEAPNPVNSQEGSRMTRHCFTLVRVPP
jgi:hypothetical protein